MLSKVLCLLLSSSQLLDTKSTDRKMTLLHYIANVVKEKYAQVSLFYNELHYVEKAAAGESCSADVFVLYSLSTFQWFSVRLHVY